MDSTKHNNAGRSFGPFHKIGLSFGSAGAIVRLSSEGKLHSVAAAWVRTRKGNTDKVFLTLPNQLLGPHEQLVKCVVLQGNEQKRRYDFHIEPEARICGMLEASSEGGCYAAVYMNRIGPVADFQTVRYLLDSQWRIQVSTGKVLGKIAEHLHEDFLPHAKDIPSAWPILYAAAGIFGGQDPEELAKMFEGRSDVAPPALPSDLETALNDEKRFRSNSRKARALSPQQAAEFRSRLNPDQIAAFDALLRGERTHLGHEVARA